MIVRRTAVPSAVKRHVGINDVGRRALLRGIGAVGIGVGALALFPSVAAAAPLTEVLVYARTAGSRYDATPAGITAIRQFGDEDGHLLDAAGDAGTSTRNAAQYQAIVWGSTAVDGHHPARRITFGSYVNSGGRYVGTRADTGHDWAWHGSLVGAYFAARPGARQAMLVVEDCMSDPTARLPAPWNSFDEWDDPRTIPRGAVNVLIRLDESSHGGDATGADHSITWWHEVGAGHAWYTGRGHTTVPRSDTLFTRMPLGGIRVVVRALPSSPGHLGPGASAPTLFTRTNSSR